MAKTSNVSVHVEPEIKKQAEPVLNQPGIPLSTAVGAFLRQVILRRGIPLEMKLPPDIPPACGSMAAGLSGPGAQKKTVMIDRRAIPAAAPEGEGRRGACL